ncbi:MAG TPA: cytochrome c [Candidatus Acidoferrales bacterium]|nr:cytochrome c [Candidatus Acidoferrales bacterium]
MAKTGRHLRVKHGAVQVASCAFLLLAACVCLGAQAEQGKTLFKKKCAVCHGENGDGSGLVGTRLRLRDIRSRDVQRQSDNQLATILRCGKGKMPGYEGRLSDHEISVLVTYMRMLVRSRRP